MKEISCLIEEISKYRKPIKIMEICGTHTQVIAQSGLRNILFSNTKLVSGPGCPVCVAQEEYIDELIEYSLMQDTVVCTFGDLLKIKGSAQTLKEAMSGGGSIKIIYSPFDILNWAQSSRNKIFILAAIGFETTLPVYASLLEEITRLKLDNIKLFTSLKSTLPAIESICREDHIDGFICPGNVAIMTGEKPFKELSKKYNKPFVISGFTLEHIISSVYAIMKKAFCTGDKFYNFYSSVVSDLGNIKANTLVKKYFGDKLYSSFWRGIGNIDSSEYRILPAFKKFEVRYGLKKNISKGNQPTELCCSDVLMGRINPPQCCFFGKKCTPIKSFGSCMESSEGACNIWFMDKLKNKGNL